MKTRFAPSCWSRFKPTTSPTAVVFLHGRTSPSGDRRILSIEADQRTIPPIFDTLRWHFRIVVPDSLRGPTDTGFVPDDPLSIAADRIYAGQPDPSDPSHFTFDYEYAGHRRRVDGWLQDGDKLRLQVRDAAE